MDELQHAFNLVSAVLLVIVFECSFGIGLGPYSQSLFAQVQPDVEKDGSIRDRNGSVIDSQPFRLTVPYSELDGLSKFRFSELVYNEALQQTEFAGERMHYWSDGLKVEGFIYAPRDKQDHKWPAIIFNRGGTSDFGAITEVELAMFHQWAKQGYVILASNYRGCSGSDGVDEWGGADVNDVLNLVPLAEKLGFVDMEKLYMIGLSRGGVSTCVALRRQMPVRAAVVMAGVTNLNTDDFAGPEFYDGNDPIFRRIGWPGWKKVWPDFESRKAEHLQNRSAVEWANEINVPLLILHARDDAKVPVGHALQLATALQDAGKEFEMVIYAHDGHSLPLNSEDRDARILNWFKSHQEK